MKKLITLLLLIILIGTTVSVGAEELNARSFGMGGAYTGVADDISAIIYNPAAVSQSGKVGIYANTGFMVEDISEFEELSNLPQYLSQDFTEDSADDIYNAVPEDLFIKSQMFLGANLKTFGGGLNVYNLTETSRGDDKAQINNTITSEGIVSFGKKLIAPYLNIGALSYGVNVKMLKTQYNEYELDKEVLQPEFTSITTKGSGLGVDAGLLIKMTDLVQLGMGVKNIFAVEYDMKGEKETSTYDPISEEWNSTTETYNGSPIKPATKVRVGASVKVPVLNATLAADIDNINLDGNSSQEITTHLGIEKDLMFNGISLRAGTYNQANSASMYTLGLGVNLLTLHVDAAVGVDETFKENHTFLISGNMKF